MAFSYKPLWKLLIDKDIKRRRLIEIANISPSTLYQLSIDSYVAMSVLDRICTALDCQVGDIVEYKRSATDAETEGGL